MKRAAELVELSREHNTALKLARDARRTADSGTEREVAEVWRKLSRCYYTEMAAHFRAEEELLFPILQSNGEYELVTTLKREHQAMRLALEDPRRQDRSRLEAIGHVLNDHVRREEREVFRKLEKIMDQTTAQAVQASLLPTLKVAEKAAP